MALAFLRFGFHILYVCVAASTHGLSGLGPSRSKLVREVVNTFTLGQDEVIRNRHTQTFAREVLHARAPPTEDGPSVVDTHIGNCSPGSK